MAYGGVDDFDTDLVCLWGCYLDCFEFKRFFWAPSNSGFTFDYLQMILVNFGGFLRLVYKCTLPTVDMLDMKCFFLIKLIWK